MSDNAGERSRPESDQAKVNRLLAGLEVVKLPRRPETEDAWHDAQAAGAHAEAAQGPARATYVDASWAGDTSGDTPGDVSERAEDAPAEPAPPRPRGPEPALDGVRAIWDTDRTHPRHHHIEPKPDRPTRRPVVGLTWLVVLSLAAAFFAWVSAEPFWLSVGHSRAGTVTVTSCEGDGATFRCAGTFTSADGAVQVPYASITGDDGAGRPGAVLPARAVSGDARTVYTGTTEGLYLRWGLGAVLIVICALGITVATGAWRLAGRQRTIAVVTSLTAPLVLSVAIVLAAW